MPVGREVKETIYEVGNKNYTKKVTKRQIEAMKVYLSYDFGYDWNDSLDRHNIFADGFFIDLLDSSFGRSLAEKYFSLVKEDFAERVGVHKRFRFYRHPSGNFDLETELKMYARDLYAQYAKVASKDKEVDVSLLHDYMGLANEHRRFRPRDIKRLTTLFIRDRKIGADPTVQRRNFAIFQARSNEEFFWNSFYGAFGPSCNSRCKLC